MLRRVLLAWRFDPPVIGIALLAILVYWLYTRGSRAAGHEPDAGRDRLFGLMVGLTVLALESPLDFLGQNYLFSAHMVQHLVLLFATGPLLAITFPPALAAEVHRYVPGWFIGLLTHPVVAYLLLSLDLWAWQSSGLFELALLSGSAHALEVLTTIEFSFLFWWVALAPEASRHPVPTLGRIVFVFLGALPPTALGAALTLTKQVLYPTYQQALDSPGLGQALQARFGLSPLVDQELGGLILWGPAGFFFLMVIVTVFLRWAAEHQARGGTIPGIKPLEKPPRRTKTGGRPA